MVFRRMPTDDYMDISDMQERLYGGRGTPHPKRNIFTEENHPERHCIAEKCPRNSWFEYSCFHFPPLFQRLPFIHFHSTAHFVVYQLREIKERVAKHRIVLKRRLSGASDGDMQKCPVRYATGAGFESWEAAGFLLDTYPRAR